MKYLEPGHPRYSEPGPRPSLPLPSWAMPSSGGRGLELDRTQSKLKKNLSEILRVWWWLSQGKGTEVKNRRWSACFIEFYCSRKASECMDSAQKPWYKEVSSNKTVCHPSFSFLFFSFISFFFLILLLSFGSFNIHWFWDTQGEKLLWIWEFLYKCIYYSSQQHWCT